MGNVSRLALIALGSNQASVWGDAAETAQKVSSFVTALSTKPMKVSRFYSTPAFPAGSGPDYVNAVIAIQTCSSAHSLLAQLHEIEAQAGRVRETRWGQRTLDLDLLAVGDTVLPDVQGHAYWRGLALAEQQVLTPDELILPHPRMQDRAFVLVPLRDVAPDWRHPILGQTVHEMCAALPSEAVGEVVPLPV